MTTPADAALVAELRALGRSLPAPGPEETATLAAAVLDRCPPPGPRPPARRPGWPSRLVAGADRRVRVALVAGLAVVALLAAPPVRAAVADWFEVGGVRVRIEPSPTRSPAPPPPAVDAAGGLAEAAAVLGGPALVPSVLGVPDGVEVSADRRLVSMSWEGGPDGVVRLDQWAADLDGVFAKTAPGARFVDVGGGFGVWFDEPHEVVLLEPDGTPRTEGARLAGSTLIWQGSARTLRLEGDLTLSRALDVAASTRAWNS